ncbi:hypothetical protein LMG29739_03015 [Paraburkholderia solisilvae]|uniref:Uncharacterized protein n=3 Tax=Paraburkholderia solisilvae TaxID=624376 RepID=A0A6J5E063_9BURK|nr:hypothetical protein LMG29739_03015 [Paraburkholderia solisilvae]
MFPFHVACDAWRGNNSFAWATSPKAEAAQGIVPAAPVSRASIPEKTQGKGVPVIPADSPDAPDADHHPEQEPTLPASRDLSVPIRLEKGVYCNWRMPGFVSECSDVTETGSYAALKPNKTPWLDREMNQRTAGSTFPTAFELSYDERAKCLYATVRVKIIPVDLIRVDTTGNARGNETLKQSVPYDTTIHYPCVFNGVGKPSRGYVMEHRDETGPRFNVETKKRQVEAVLNGHRSKLILDGCSKGSSCGCRVSVLFQVEFFVSVRGAEVGNGKKMHKTIHLFPRAQRADAGAWGEIGMLPDKDGAWTDDLRDTNVVAHECGHLFNFPDEYWAYGGWVHRMYIDDGQLNFNLGDANRGKEVWQISAAANIMGAACNNPVPDARNVAPSASVHPYYLEYIRRHFSELTHKNWKVGYVAE